MKYIEKEMVERETKETEAGFKYVTERRSGEVYEKNNNGGEPEKDLELTGGSNAYDEKIVTPDGEELETITEVFEWLEENGDRFQQSQNLKFGSGSTTVFPQSSWTIDTSGSSGSSSKINLSDH